MQVKLGPSRSRLCSCWSLRKAARLQTDLSADIIPTDNNNRSQRVAYFRHHVMAFWPFRPARLAAKPSPSVFKTRALLWRTTTLWEQLKQGGHPFRRRV